MKILKNPYGHYLVQHGSKYAFFDKEYQKIRDASSTEWDAGIEAGWEEMIPGVALIENLKLKFES